MKRSPALTDTDGMHPHRSLLISVLLVLAPAGCHIGQAAAPTPSSAPLMIDDRGIVMPLEQAVTKISYRPWIPPEPHVLKYAVIPPLGDQDTPANRGVAIEYENNRMTWLLSEWPKQNFDLLFLRGQDITHAPCAVAHYKPDGVAWSTRGKLAMTLQPDGSVPAETVGSEARRLIAAGACK